MNLTKLIADEVHKPVHKVNNFRSVNAKFKNHIWTMDLVDMTPFDMPKINDNYKYLLTCMDVYTRYAWVIPMKNKSGPETTNAIQEIINQSKSSPEFIYCDEGKEFYNINVKKLRDKYNIGIYSTLGKHKASLIERFNKTFKSLMYKQFTVNQNRRYIDIIDNLINQYNNNIHKGINNLTPDSIFNNKNNIEIPKNIKYENLPNPKFKLNDLVRTTYKKNVYDKGYLPGWTYELFKIAKIIKSNPITYKLKDLQGEMLKEIFYEKELKKSNQNPDEGLVEEVIKERGSGKNKEYLVKWIGFPSKFNSWINDKDTIVKFKKGV